MGRCKADIEENNPCYQVCCNECENIIDCDNPCISRKDECGKYEESEEANV